jgi:large subunit ribosomal protein L3
MRQKEVRSMKKAILATKVGMTQIFMEDGTLVPVTVLQAGPNVVTQVKTVENDGYEAVQVGFGDAVDRAKSKDKNGRVEVAHRHGVNKAQQGQFEKAGVDSKKYLREFRFENTADYKVGAEIKADIFAEGDKIDATAISKGKGFRSAIQKGQHRGPMGHGSKFHRHQGSNNSSSTPSRVFKGKGMPGHDGSVQVTVRNLEVVKVDPEKNLILVKGAVPGPKKGLVTLKETTKVEC